MPDSLWLGIKECFRELGFEQDCYHFSGFHLLIHLFNKHYGVHVTLSIMLETQKNKAEPMSLRNSYNER